MIMHSSVNRNYGLFYLFGISTSFTLRFLLSFSLCITNILKILEHTPGTMTLLTSFSKFSQFFLLIVFYSHLPAMT